MIEWIAASTGLDRIRSNRRVIVRARPFGMLHAMHLDTGETPPGCPVEGWVLFPLEPRQPYRLQPRDSGLIRCGFCDTAVAGDG